LVIDSVSEGRMIAVRAGRTGDQLPVERRIQLMWMNR